jgi:hypothetical protein
VLTLAPLLVGCAPEPVWSLPYVHTVVPWVRDREGYWYLFDTGTPRTQVTTEVAGLEPGEQVVPGWGVGELVPDEPIVVSDDLPALLGAAIEAGEIVNFGGIVGADLLYDQAWWMDPRSELVWFGEGPPGVRTEASVPARLVGEGSTCLADGPCVDFPRARILVEVQVEGSPLTLLLDTASTYVTLPPLVAERLGIDLFTLDFESEAVTVGQADVRLGGAGGEIPVAAMDEPIVEALVRLSLEVDQPVDGLLGHSLLRSFVLGVDPRRGELTLGTYTAGEWGSSWTWTTPGFFLGDGGEEGYPVLAVIQGSPAALAGISAGEILSSVDGLTPADVPAAEIMVHLTELGPGALVEVAWEGQSAALESSWWGRGD